MNQESARASGKSYLKPLRSPKSVSPGPMPRMYFSQNCSALLWSLVQLSVTKVEHLQWSHVRSGQVSGLQVMRKCLYLAGNVIVRYVQLLLLKINILIADLEV